MSHDIPSSVKHVIDTAAVAAAAAPFIWSIPAVIASVTGILTSIWIGTRIFEALFPRHYRTFISWLDCSKDENKYLDGTNVPNTRRRNGE